jgi:hypothetical protein
MMPVFGDPANLVEREEEPDGAAEPASALDYLQDVYRGRRVAEHSRMRAAMAALPFESPKLAVTTNLTNERFAVLLEKAVLRSKAPLVIDHQPTERPLPEAPPPGIRGRSGEGQR